jgi:dihydroorotate dehydrogenase (NAD+) catalytic subunit
MLSGIYDAHKTFDENLKSGPNPKFISDNSEPIIKDISFDLFGYRIGSRYGSSACPAGSDSRYISNSFAAGFDIVTTKTRRSKLVDTNPMPNLLRVTPKDFSYESAQTVLPLFQEIDHANNKHMISLVNSFGNNSLSTETWVKDDSHINSVLHPDQLLITSIVGTLYPNKTVTDYYEDFGITAQLAHQSGARAIEINFSCPNVANEGILCYDPLAVESICKLVRSSVGNTPVIAKFGYFNARQYELLKKIISTIASCIDAVSAINTIPVEVNTLSGTSYYGGLSGYPLKQYGLAMTRRLAAIRSELDANFQIFGMGGVLKATDFQEYRDAGADVVLSASGAMYNPNLAQEIKQSL